MTRKQQREALARNRARRSKLPSVREEVAAMFAGLQGPRANHKTALRGGSDEPGSRNNRVKDKDAPELWLPEHAEHSLKFIPNK